MKTLLLVILLTLTVSADTCMEDYKSWLMNRKSVQGEDMKKAVLAYKGIVLHRCELLDREDVQVYTSLVETYPIVCQK